MSKRPNNDWRAFLQSVPGPVKLAWLFAAGLGLVVTLVILWAIIDVVSWLTR